MSDYEPTAEMVETVAHVLDEHRAFPPSSPHCKCGWRPSLSLNDTEADRRQHRTHQARAVLAAVGPMIAAGALRALAGDMGESQFYVEGTFWYEEAHRRADQIEEGRA